MKTVKEVTMVPVTTCRYIAEDGTEFKLEWECINYEARLRDKKTKKFRERLSKMALAEWSEEYSGLGGYLGEGGGTVRLVKVDKELIEFAESMDWPCAEDLKKYIGRLVFIGGLTEGEECYFEGTVDSIIADLEVEVAQLKRYKEQADEH